MTQTPHNCNICLDCSASPHGTGGQEELMETDLNMKFMLPAVS